MRKYAVWLAALVLAGCKHEEMRIIYEGDGFDPPKIEPTPEPTLPKWSLLRFQGGNPSGAASDFWVPSEVLFAGSGSAGGPRRVDAVQPIGYGEDGTVTDWVETSYLIDCAPATIKLLGVVRHSPSTATGEQHPGAFAESALPPALSYFVAATCAPATQPQAMANSVAEALSQSARLHQQDIEKQKASTHPGAQ